MSTSAEQIDEGKFRNFISRKEKKYSKRLQSRRKRRERKNLDNPSPHHNRYSG